MSNADLSNRDPSLLVKDVEGMLEQLSKQIPFPEGGLLRGEVLGTFSGGRGVHLRDGGRATVEVRVEEPIVAERGDFVEVSGVPELVAEAAPVGLRVVWRGGTAKNSGASPRFRERRAFVEERAARLPFTTPRITPRLRSGGRVRVITERHSKAWESVAEAARQYRWLKPDARYCEDMRDATALEAVLVSLPALVQPHDVVLVASGGGDLAALDVFEDERVVAALARLTVRCSTILAVGHAGEELMTNKVVTYPIESAAAAVQLILRESGEGGAAVVADDRASSPGVDDPALEALPGGRPSRERLSSPPGPVASATRSGPSRPAAVLLRVLLLGAAAYLGWWARGFFSEGAATAQHTAARAP